MDERRRRWKRPAERWLALYCWAYLAWLVLSWTRTAEQLGFGAVLAALVASVCAPLGDVVGPWRLLEPCRLRVVCRIVGYVAWSVVRANLSLARRVWLPSRPLRAGMVVVASTARTEGAITAVGILTSLSVDNQLVDLDRDRGELQYHTVWTTTEDPAANRREINGRLEELLGMLADGEDLGEAAR